MLLHSFGQHKLEFQIGVYVKHSLSLSFLFDAVCPFFVHKIKCQLIKLQ